MNIILIFITQLIYSLSDLGKKIILQKTPYGFGLITNWKFVLITAAAGIGFFIQLYVMSRYELSRTIILLGIFAVVLSAIFGAAFLHERLTPINIVGIVLAIAAIILVQIR